MSGADVDKEPDSEAQIAAAQAKLRHELRTPLNHIIGYSELLIDEARERGLEDLIPDLQNIHTAGSELLALINDVLDADRHTGAGTSSERANVSDPLEHAAAPGPAVPAPSTEKVQAHVLVVDDNAKNRDIVARLLEREGYGVSMAENGAEAIEAVKARPVDLVLMDVMMPVMDGVEACRHLKEDAETRLIPVVIMTALGQVEHRVRGIRAGADDFLTKPVSRDELLARIQTSLRLKQTVDAKVDRLRGAQEYLTRFVPQSVIRGLEEHPESPALERTDQDMSALFVDVSGYTRLSEDMRQTADFMVEKYFSRFLDAIHAHGGDVTETSGDGMMVVFPGDDPAGHAVAAVSAAVAIQQKTAELNAQLAGIFDPISVHIGINSGIALIGPTKYEGASGVRWVYTALGPAVNLAARIAGVADGGMICVGPETERRLGGRFETQALGRRQLKNVRDEVMIHQVVVPGVPPAPSSPNEPE
ncbi:MAG: response regulator [Gammaproteobacteria bacterium]|nr:response regulator [Gammaproteobacteria bacterium]